jgi:hypothetical protein
MKVYYNFEIPGEHTRETYINIESVRISTILELKEAVAARFEVAEHRLSVLAFNGTELGDRQDIDPSVHGVDADHCLTIKLKPHGTFNFLSRLSGLSASVAQIIACVLDVDTYSAILVFFDIH